MLIVGEEQEIDAGKLRERPELILPSLLLPLS
jgi:hypothetical protein